MANTVRVYLKLDGIPGDAQDEKYKDQIEVHGYAIDAANSSSASYGEGHSTGPGYVGDLNLSKPYCKASVNLWHRCCSGKHIPKGLLTVVSYAGDEKLETLKIDFDHLFVTAYHTSASGQSEPVDSVSLAFTAMKSLHTTQANSGSPARKIDGGWNNQTNKRS